MYKAVAMEQPSGTAERQALTAAPRRRERRGQLRRRDDGLRKQYGDRYRALFDRSHDMVYLHNFNGDFLDANNATLTALGYTREEICRLNFTTLVDEQQLPKAISVLKELQKTGQQKEPAEFTIRCRDGHCLEVEVISSVIHYSGESYAVQGIARNLAMRKRIAMEELRAEKLASIGILAGGIAHDFNNILTGILGNIDIAMMDVKTGSKAKERLKSAENACLRAKELTQRLLTFAGGGAPVKKTISYTRLLRESVDFVDMGVSALCQLRIPADLWLGEADEGQISGAISNIIINAKQAMPPGGALKIAARNMTVDEGQVPMLKKGRYVEISVEDKGSGIEPENLKKIFDPFFTTKANGSGLGLSAASSIVKNHGGLITVESKPGAGSTFYIYLPASSKPAQKVNERKETPLQARGRVLVMDDDEEIRQVASHMLDELGYKDVELASDGTEAISQYRKALAAGKPFDVVIIDLTIPGGMGGKEAMQKLLEIDPRAKGVVSSGYSSDLGMAKYKSYGFCGVLAKPYTSKELNSCICRVLGSTDDYSTES
jgi:PAS domain S-box-containing protein